MPCPKPSTYDKWFLILLFLVAILRLSVIYYSPFDLAPDEAHYWEWSRRLDLAYYSKGPIVALLIKFGTAILGDNAVGVRIFALICSLLFLVVLYHFIREIWGAQSALVTSLLISVTLVFVTHGIVMTTDPPLALFWLLSLRALYEAVLKSKVQYWIFFGLFAGLATLSKYTAFVLFPAIFCWLIFAPSLRGHLCKRSFYVGGVIYLLTLVPVMVWNWKHAWVNFYHNASHLGARSGLALRPQYFFELLGGQFGLVGPILFSSVLFALLWGYRRVRKNDELAGLFFYPSVMLMMICVVLSLFKRVYANWPMPVAIGGVLLLVYYCNERGGASSRFCKKWLKPCILLNVSLVMLVHGVFFGLTYGFPAKRLTTKKLVGWSELGAYVSKAVQIASETEKLNRDDIFVIANGYGEASEIAFYSSPHLNVLCDNDGGRRMNQYDIWGGWELEKGKTALVVVKNGELNPALAGKFSRFEPFRKLEELQISYAGDELRNFRLYIGYNFSGAKPQATRRF